MRLQRFAKCQLAIERIRLAIRQGLCIHYRRQFIQRLILPRIHKPVHQPRTIHAIRKMQTTLRRFQIKHQRIARIDR
jgi:hypothetical protein